ncbi:MAG: type VI secretion system tip protein TssI/VgrG [Polyangiaceae bacterium]
MEVRVVTNSGVFAARRVHVDSALGEPLKAHVELSMPEPVDGATLVKEAVRIEVVADDGTMTAYHGIVSEITARATRRADSERSYTLEVRSAIELLAHHRTHRVFRKKTATKIVEELLAQAHIEGEAFSKEVSEEPPEREYVTQWGETDLQFLRRICEEEGLYYRFETKDGFDAFVLCDHSPDAASPLDGPLQFVDAAGARTTDAVAFHPSLHRRRAPGKATVRDFDPAKPALTLEGTREDGLDPEKTIEVYAAPGRFKTEGDGKRAARLTLEALRATVVTLRFETRAYALRPGHSFESDPQGPNAPTGKFLVVRTSFDWRAGAGVGALSVTAIPLETPYRLPRVTARPRIHGILTATTTGASGEEIHTDNAGQVKVRFGFDREGPTDDTSSLPVRVMQNNVPGSMLIPRVGWEVLVGFEDGDPDRPFVLGRSFNGKQRPPFGLPANKTMTALGTVSSPGGAKSNVVSLDDGAGRQHMMFNAGFGKTTIVGGNMVNQTVGFDNTHIKGSQTWSVGGNETVAVSNAWAVGVGSQSASVGGNQNLTIKATGSTSVGSETVVVGANLVELVGNPADGLAAFAKSAVVSAVSEIPAVGPALTKAYSWGSSMYEGYKKGGWKGAAEAAAQSAIGEIAGQIPGADAGVAALDAAGITPWSEKAQQRASEQAAGGGGAGAGAAGAGAAAAAPGHRKWVVDGTVTEVIGAIHAIETPGSLKWTTLGASTFGIGGSHATSAIRISRLTMAASADTASLTSLTARSAIGRNVKTAHSLKAGGILKLKSGGEAGFKASGALSLKASGPASFEGGTVVFEVGGSSVSIHGGGVTLKSSSITVNGKTQHSGKESTG